MGVKSPPKSSLGDEKGSNVLIRAIKRVAPLDPDDLRASQLVAACLAMAVPLAAFALFLQFPDSDVLLGSPTTHFYMVSAIAGLAMVLAVAVVWAARRLPDSRTFFLAMGFVSMATIFLAHGLGTSPFFGVGHNHGDAYSAYPGGVDDDDAAGSSATTGPVAARTAFDPTYGYGGGAPTAASEAPMDHSGHTGTGAVTDTDGAGATPSDSGAEDAAAARGTVRSRPCRASGWP